MLNFLSLLAFENLQPMRWDALGPALNFLWQGLLAIFVVIGLIICAVKLTAWGITKAAEYKKQMEEQRAAEENEQNQQ